MLPSLPLDVNNNQLRVGDKVAYSASDSCHMFLGRVVKMTPCFAWMVPVGFPDDYSNKDRREFSQVVFIEGKQ